MIDHDVVLILWCCNVVLLWFYNDIIDYDVMIDSLMFRSPKKMLDDNVTYCNLKAFFWGGGGESEGTHCKY